MSPTRFDPYEPDLLPAVVRRYLESQRNSTRELPADTVFTTDARVVDEDTEYLGSATIREWWTKSANQYTYTLDCIGQARTADDTWLVAGHLEGNFPGGQADLWCRFRLDGNKVCDLLIEPPPAR
ncbi:hypothetical protein H483_0115605 [Dietzia sp. UCD-THP]|uniref:hypothetical protein n=1 Tax=Dietzia sp. UCD-THP TaxID=1292020 RepID=UPI0003819824|nr:hypothetical protein [Dietzia sp. UCD-THP]EYT57300.1 hypothetical protein H483_0115605 [Dietzia sp. UCD-THP]